MVSSSSKPSRAFDPLKMAVNANIFCNVDSLISEGENLSIGCVFVLGSRVFQLLTS